MDDVTIVIATFGDHSWIDLARERALPSALSQNVPVIMEHGTLLDDARNAGLLRVTTKWVVFLDADDELEADYIPRLLSGSADLRAPSVRYIRNGRGETPRVPRVAGHHHLCVAGCLTQGNWLVVGTLAPVDLLKQVGGWRDFPWSEDWDLWLRCYLAGATVEAIPTAVYRAHVRPGSRNRALPLAEKISVHRAIEKANGLAPGGKEFL